MNKHVKRKVIGTAGKILLVTAVVSSVAVLASCGGGSSSDSSAQRTSDTIVVGAKPASPAAVPSGSVRMSLSPASKTVATGDQFTMDVVIESALQMGGAQVALKFDPVLLKCDAVDEGAFFKTFAAANGTTTINYPQAAIDNKRGLVSDFGIALMGMAKKWDEGDDTVEGASGKGTLATYHFTALTSGTAQPALARPEVVDPSGAVKYDVKAQ